MSPRNASIDLASLGEFPLPPLDEVDDKEGRGLVLVVAGGARVPGAPLLTGIAALRAGAGKLQLAAPKAAAVAMGLAAPEAAVLQVPSSPGGDIATQAHLALGAAVQEADAV